MTKVPHWTIKITNEISGRIAYQRNSNASLEKVVALAERKAKTYLLGCKVEIIDNWGDYRRTYYANK